MDNTEKNSFRSFYHVEKRREIFYKVLLVFLLIEKKYFIISLKK